MPVRPVAPLRGGVDRPACRGLGSGRDWVAPACPGRRIGTELWRYDGVNAPSIVKDLYRGSIHGLEYQHDGAPRVYDGALYFAGNDGTGEELWKYDGTNFSRVTDIHPDSNGHADIRDLTVFNGVLYFHADNGQDGRELWAYNADGWVV